MTDEDKGLRTASAPTLMGNDGPVFALWCLLRPGAGTMPESLAIMAGHILDDVRKDERLMAERRRASAPTGGNAREILSRLDDWTYQYGAELVPRHGSADTFGDGVRACKARVAGILSQLRTPSIDASPAPVSSNAPPLVLVDLLDALDDAVRHKVPHEGQRSIANVAKALRRAVAEQRTGSGSHGRQEGMSITAALRVVEASRAYLAAREPNGEQRTKPWEQREQLRAALAALDATPCARPAEFLTGMVEVPRSAGVSMCECNYPGETHDVDCPCYVAPSAPNACPDFLNCEGCKACRDGWISACRDHGVAGPSSSLAVEVPVAQYDALRKLAEAARVHITIPFVDEHNSTATWIGAERDFRAAVREWADQFTSPAKEKP